MINNPNNLDSRIVAWNKLTHMPITAGEIVNYIVNVLSSNYLMKHKIKICEHYIKCIIPHIIKAEINLPTDKEELAGTIMEENVFANVHIMYVNELGDLAQCIVPLAAKDSRYFYFGRS